MKEISCDYCYGRDDTLVRESTADVGKFQRW